MKHLDGMQVTLPLFDKSLLSVEEEMAELPQPPLSRRRIEILGGFNKGSGQNRRLFAAGRIRTEGGRKEK